jgi:hypothetical protein
MPRTYSTPKRVTGSPSIGVDNLYLDHWKSRSLNLSYDGKSPALVDIAGGASAQVAIQLTVRGPVRLLLAPLGR